MNIEDILALLRQFMRDRARQYHISSLGVFGSMVRGTSGEDSDIDIVFESDTPSLLRTSHMRQELEELLGLPVDIVRIRRRMNPRLREQIEQEARFV